MFADGATQFAARLKTDTRRLVADIEHHGHAPRRDVGQRLDVGELYAPVTGYIELAKRPAITGRFVEIDEAGRHGLARHDLHFRIERRPDRQSAFVEFLFAVTLKNIAPDFLGKILAGENVRAIAAVGDDKRILARLVGIGLLDPAIFQQAIDHVITPLDGTIAVAYMLGGT